MNESSSSEKRSYIQFLKEILKIKGVPQILFMSISMSFGAGTFAISPAITSDKYARYYHGYSGPFCSIANVDGMIPAACSLGAASAQNAASVASFVQYTLAFLTGPLLGSLSDRYGRRNFIFLGIICFSLGPFALLWIQIFPNTNPVLYYLASLCLGLASWFIPTYALMSDVVPPHLRAVAFSLILMTASAAIAIISEIAALFGFFLATIVSVACCLLGLVFAIFVLPETLSMENRQKAILKMEEDEQANGLPNICFRILRPVKDLGMLNRNIFFQLMTFVVVLSLITKAGEQTVQVFYFEGQLGFTQQDISIFLVIHSCAIVIAQSIVLHALIQRIGERYVVIVTMIAGVIFSFLYGIAKSPALIYFAAVISAASGMSFSTFSSMMSFNVKEYEQGSIQGVLASLQAVSNAFGPLLLNFIFDKTADGALFGAGTMFFASVLLYVIAMILSFALPPELANSRELRKREHNLSEHLLTQDTTNEDV